MIGFVRRVAIPIAVVSIVVNCVILIVSLILWGMAIYLGWVDSVEFVAHVSMLALVFSAISGVAAALAGVLALVPTDDIIIDKENESD